MVLIFDYFETLLISKSMDFNRGLKVFWEKYYSDKCAFEDIKAYGEELFELFLSKHDEGKEFSFVGEELPLYAKKYGGEAICMDAEEEADYLMNCNEFEINPGLEILLEKCSNIPMYVVSNSAFRDEALMTVLNRMGIGRYFKRLWSSADFGRIKPCKEFFELAIQTALSDNPSEKREDMIYIGDLYESDVVGAYNAGIKAAWLNKKNEEDIKGLAAYNVTSIAELTEMIL